MNAASNRIDLSVVTGSLNRLPLLKETLRSVRTNGFTGVMELIVVDGGSRDGTLEWLAKQADVLTIIQPNYTQWVGGAHRRVHTWGEFINVGFRNSRGRWILMVSDDLVLSNGCIESGLRQLEGYGFGDSAPGAGAIFYRDYPRNNQYHVKCLPRGVVLVNHGFFRRSALETIGYADETSYEFYAADGDLCMRLAQAGFPIVPLDGCFADHLAHTPKIGRLFSRGQERSSDMRNFEAKWGMLPTGPSGSILSGVAVGAKPGRVFWRLKPVQCALAMAATLFDASTRRTSE